MTAILNGAELVEGEEVDDTVVLLGCCASVGITRQAARAREQKIVERVFI
jgi:hypothetical protein